MKGLQIALALDAPEPAQARQAQRIAERDRTLATAGNDLREQVFALAEVVTDQVIAAQGGVTGTRLKLAMVAAGYGELIAQIDKRWAGWFLNPQRGFRSIGRVAEGSKGRRVDIWVRAGSAEP